MHSSDGTARTPIDWRDWVAFLGYVLATAVVVSVALASIVLILSTQAADPLPAYVERPGERPVPHRIAPSARPAPAPERSAKAPGATAGERLAPAASTPVPPGTPRSAVAPVAASTAAEPPQLAAGTASGSPAAEPLASGTPAVLPQPVPEPSPAAASILQPSPAPAQPALAAPAPAPTPAATVGAGTAHSAR